MSRELDTVLENYRRVTLLPEPARREAMRKLGREDLFFLMVVVGGRRDMSHQWLLERADEVGAEPDGFLDLWPRDHRKSSVVTIWKTIQDIIKDGEVTCCILSHTRPIAKKFLKSIKRELEANEVLRALYDDVIWANPYKEAPSWSEDGGIIVKRKGNPKEATLEAWGLVDGQPTGAHFQMRVYDDIITRENASSPDMRAKVLEAYEQSLNLGTRGGSQRMVGTRYHYDDAYAEILKRGTFKPRIYRAVGPDGEPVLLTKEELADKRRDMGMYVYSSQMMLDPRAEGSIRFEEAWLRYHDGNITGNRYIIVDPANEKKKKSDYTAMWVVVASSDGNIYVEWMIRDRLGLTERINLVMWAHREFAPISGVGYEKYGMQADIEALRDEQRRQGYRFEVTELGGQLAKNDRIQKLMPRFERGGVYLPFGLYVDTRDPGTRVDMSHLFKHEEYLAWPYAAHDDMLDCLARIEDPALGIVWPKPIVKPDRYSRGEKRRSSGGWMAA